jgi:hypothetical protein
MLVAMAAPLVVFQMAILVFSHPGLAKTTGTDALDLYAGQHEVTKSFWQSSLTSYPMDIEIDESMDILSDAGIVVL